MFLFRRPIFLVFAVWLAFAAWEATHLSPLTDEEEFVPYDHPSRLIERLIDESFPAATDEMPFVEIYWGGKSIDKSTVHPFNSSYTGEIVMDEMFDMA